MFYCDLLLYLTLSVCLSVCFVCTPTHGTERCRRCKTLLKPLDMRRHLTEHRARRHLTVHRAYLLYLSHALLHLDIQSMASSSCSWLLQQVLNSIVCGCWLQWLQVGVILFPHLCRVSVVQQWPLLSWFNKTHSPRGSAGFLSPCRCTEGSSMRYALLTSECCIRLTD